MAVGWVEDARRAAREIREAIRDPRLLLWVLYLLAAPIYIFDSGLPQPGDYLVFLIGPLVFFRPRPVSSQVVTQVKRMLVAFVVYVILINLMWSAVLGQWTFVARYGFLLSPVFYIYNVVMFFVVMALYEQYRERFLWLTAKMVLVSLLAQVVLSGVIVSPGLRETVLFNNANQLGFYAVLSASILFVLRRKDYTSTTELTAGMVAAVYLCLISASKAALGAIGILAIFGAFVRLRTMIVIGIVFGLSLLIASPMVDAIEQAMSRPSKPTNLSFAEERGYDRIFNNPEYIITGAGEGGYGRFIESTVIGKHEIHSSLGTLLFCYGIVGFTLFGLYIWTILRGTGLRTWMIVAPSFAFGMTHQGLRSTLFWVLLAVVLAIKVQHPARRSNVI